LLYVDDVERDVCCNGLLERDERQRGFLKTVIYAEPCAVGHDRDDLGKFLVCGGAGRLGLGLVVVDNRQLDHAVSLADLDVGLRLVGAQKTPGYLVDLGDVPREGYLDGAVVDYGDRDVACRVAKRKQLRCEVQAKLFDKGDVVAGWGGAWVSRADGALLMWGNSWKKY
jgi:hypothetical protein